MTMELRAERRNGMIKIAERRAFHVDFETRTAPNGTGGSKLILEGYAATTETPFPMWDMWGEEYSEVMSQGCFGRTLARSPDVPLLIGHNAGGIALARTKSGTMTLAEDTTGLAVRTPDGLDLGSPLVQALASAMERGDMDEMSFAFQVISQLWSPDYTERRINEVDIHRGDVSMVVHGANDTTSASVSRAARNPALEGRAPTTPYAPSDDHTQICPQCNSGNGPDAAFCSQCGQVMNEDASTVITADPSGLIVEGDQELSAANIARLMQVRFLA